MFRMRCLLAMVCLLAAAPVLGEEPTLKTDDDKVLYAIGLSVARNLASYNLDADQLRLLQAGLSDGVLGREPKVDVNEYQPKIHAFAQERMKAAADREKKAAGEFLEKAAAEDGAVKTESGLIYVELKPGEGDSPGARSPRSRPAATNRPAGERSPAGGRAPRGSGGRRQRRRPARSSEG